MTENYKSPYGSIVEANPWSLTPRQVDSLNAVCDLGTYALAAKALGVGVRTIEGHVLTAGKRMGAPGLMKYLAWDRWRSAAMGRLTKAKEARKTLDKASDGQDIPAHWIAEALVVTGDLDERVESALRENTYSTPGLSG